MHDFDSEAKPGDVEITISHGTSNQPPYRLVHLEITERISRQRVVEISLTSEQFGILLGSATVYASAELPPHPERIGKRMEVDTQEVAHAIGDEAVTQAEAIARAYWDGGWDSVQARRTNRGMNITARRWVSP
jgi:hypothetical protein